MAVKKLDYNGLKTLVQYIKFYISQLLSNYISLSSGGTLTGEIVCTNHTAYGVKGEIPEVDICGTAFIARDTSNIGNHGSESYPARYAKFETLVDSSDGACSSFITVYKNETNGTANTTLSVKYPMTGDPYIQVNSHIKLSSGVEIY